MIPIPSHKPLLGAEPLPRAVSSGQALVMPSVSDGFLMCYPPSVGHPLADPCRLLLCCHLPASTGTLLSNASAGIIDKHHEFFGDGVYQELTFKSVELTVASNGPHKAVSSDELP